jgi:hypothetical protein
MKMNKVSFFMTAVLVAASSVCFVGCEDIKDLLEAPTITVNLNGTDQNSISVSPGENVVARIDCKAEGGIKRIEFMVVNGNDVTGYPKTSGFQNANSHQVSHTFTGLGDGTHNYSIIVIDKKDKSKNTQITITVTCTPLSNPATFLFVYEGAGNPNNQLSAIGLTWATTTPNPLTTVRLNGDIVALTKAQFDAIECKQAIQAAYNTGTKADNILVTVAPTYAHRYFIVKSGSAYYLVETIDGESDATESLIEIRYRQ